MSRQYIADFSVLFAPATDADTLGADATTRKPGTGKRGRPSLMDRLYWPMVETVVNSGQKYKVEIPKHYVLARMGKNGPRRMDHATAAAQAAGHMVKFRAFRISDTSPLVRLVCEPVA